MLVMIVITVRIRRFENPLQQLENPGISAVQIYSPQLFEVFSEPNGGFIDRMAISFFAVGHFGPSIQLI